MRHNLQTIPRSRVLWFGMSLSFLALLCIASLLHAQAIDLTEEQPAVSDATQSTTSGQSRPQGNLTPLPLRAPISRRQVVSDHLVRLAEYLLMGSTTPAQHQLDCARFLMDEAIKLTPNSPELWWQRAELAAAENDTAMQRKALREYLRLRPEHDAVELQLIQLDLNEAQTVEERLQKVRDLLEGDRASRMTQALKSRLAFYASNAARELGDTDQSLRWLLQALRADKSNKQAAVAAYQVLVDRNVGPEKIGQALTSIIEADPYDPAPRQRLADLLLRERDFEHAALFYQIAADLLAFPPGDRNYYERLLQANPDTDFIRRWTIALATSGQPEKALEILQQTELAMRSIARKVELQQQAQQETQGDGQDELLPEPDDVGIDEDEETAQPPAATEIKLPVDLQAVRVAILSTMPNREQDVKDQFDTLAAMVQQQAGGQLTPEATAGLRWWADMFNVPYNAAVADESDLDEQLLARLNGFALLRSDSLVEAEKKFTPFAGSDPYCALGYVMTRLTDQSVKLDRKVQLLQAVVNQAPDQITAVLASNMLRELDATTRNTPSAQRLREITVGWNARTLNPATIDERSQMPTGLVDLKLDFDPIEYDYLEPIRGTLTVRNVASVPLSFGQGGVAADLLQVQVTPKAGGGARIPMPVYFTQAIGRKLRIEQGETFEIPVRLDRGLFGLILDDQMDNALTYGMPEGLSRVSGPGQTFTMNLRVAAGLQPTPFGGFMTSVRTVQSRFFLVQRNALQAPMSRYKELVTAMERGKSSNEDLIAISALSAIQSMDVPTDELEDLRDAVDEAVVNQFAKMDDLAKVWTLAMLPKVENDRFVKIYAEAEDSDNDLVVAMVLVHHVTDPNDTRLEFLANNGSREIRRFAQAHKKYLADVKEYVDQMEAEEAAASTATAP